MGCIKNGDGSVIAKWTLEDRTLTISGTGEMKDWKFDSKEDWHNTQYTNVIENVIIENGITSIGEKAFYGCSSLQSITIPRGVTSIGEKAIPETTIIYTKIGVKHIDMQRKINK